MMRRYLARRNRGYIETFGRSKGGWGGGSLARSVLAVTLILLLLVPCSNKSVSGASSRDSNNSFDTAVRVVNGIQIAPEYLGIPDDPQDYYWIEVTKGQALEASLIILQNGTKGYDFTDPDKVNFELEVYGPLDQTKSLESSKTTDQFETVSILAVVDGKYYFKIYAVNGTGDYVFRVVIYTPQTVTDNGVYSGYLKHDSDNDTYWYRIYLKGGDPSQTVLVNMSHDTTGGLDLYLEEMWSDKMPYFVNISLDLTKRPDSVYGVASYTGYYYIQVHAFSGYGNYQIRVRLGSMATDNNNDKNHAILLNYNTTWTDHVNQATDKYDYFQVNLGPQENISLHLTLLNGWHDIFSLFLLDVDLNIITEKTNYVFTPTHHTVADDQYWNIVDGGVYFVVVMAKVALAANPDDLSDATAAADYRLQVNMSKHPPKPLNKAPTIKAGFENLTIQFDQDSSKHMNLNDVFQSNDGDQLNFTAKVVDGPLTTSADMGGLLTIIPGNGWFGTGHLNLTARDPEGLKAVLIAKVVVVHVDAPPVVTDCNPARNAQIGEGKTQIFNVSVTDKDDTVLFFNWSVDGKDQNWTGPDFTYRPAYGSAGQHLIVERVSDTKNNITWDWTITVTHTNRPPVLVLIGPKNGTATTEGKKVHFTATMEDPDKDVMTYEWREGLQVLDKGTGARTDFNQSFSQGRHTVKLTVSDPSGGTVTTTINFTVQPKPIGSDLGTYVPIVIVVIIVLAMLAVFFYLRSPRKVDKRAWDEKIDKKLSSSGKKKGKTAKVVAEQADEALDEDIDKEIAAEKMRSRPDDDE
jgi:hypothetical protein